jgi:deoxyribose-phosphate aldolase
MNLENILSRCDHTLLRQDATGDEIMQLCDEAIRYHCASVCIPPCHVAGAKRYVGDEMKICTVVGFPNGYNTPKVKAFEAQEAIKNGTDEIDMVVNLAMVKDGCWDDIYNEIRIVREFTAGHVLKVIIETCLLTEEEKRTMCSVVSASGADYIKTSTGFSTGGATREDVALLRACCEEHVKVKAAGGIASLEDAQDFIDLGADRLGTSRIVKLVEKQLESAPSAAPADPEE